MLGDFLDVSAVIQAEVRDSEYIFKLKLKEFVDGLDVRSNVKI